MKWPWSKPAPVQRVVKREPASFAEIIAPLTGITAQLEKHVTKMNDRREGLEVQKTSIEEQIADAIQERTESEGMAARLRQFTTGTAADSAGESD